MRQTYLTSVFLFAVLTACGGDSKNTPQPDAAGGAIDAPQGSSMVTITGTAVELTASGTTPVASAVIAAYSNSDATTPVTMTTSNAQGMFTLMISTGGGLDGYLKATKAGLLDTYLYAPAPITGEATAPVNMISSGTLGLLTLVAGVTQQPGKGLIALVVVNGATATSTPVEGVAVSSNPAASAYRYNSGGLPSSTATATATDGTAYMFNLPPNVAVTVSATKTGSTFTSHSLKAVPDVLTTTIITP